MWRARARVARFWHVGVMDLVTAYVDTVDRLVAVAHQQLKDMYGQVRPRLASDGPGEDGCGGLRLWGCAAGLSMYRCKGSVYGWRHRQDSAAAHQWLRVTGVARVGHAN
jgi:hypothetical protein